VLVDLRATLRDASASELVGLFAPVFEALSADGEVDLTRVRVVCDWVQYRHSFRDVVEVRQILPGGRHVPGSDPVVEPENLRADDLEVAVDARRSDGADLAAITRARLAGDSGRVYLEEWCRGSASCIWGFNSRYWSDLDAWERSTGRGYQQALPGGESDGANRAAAEELIRGLFAQWDPMADSGALPDELYVVEFGVGDGSQARTFLDAFAELDAEHGRGYYQRLHYLMCDYSPHVLALARTAVAHHGMRVSSFALDAVHPLTSLGFLAYKVFLVYISNVYDNLPTDEVAHLGGRTYLVETRAYLPAVAAEELTALARLGSREELPALVHKLLRLGPALLAEAMPASFADDAAAVGFWRQAWESVRIEERYQPLPGLDLYPITDDLSGELLRPLLDSGADVRMHVSNGALSSFAEGLRLLHPLGRLVCHDLFVTEPGGYRTAFRGPGKYDGSVVNWVNGPLLAHVARRRGFDVRYEPFRHRASSNIVTLTAEARD